MRKASALGAALVIVCASAGPAAAGEPLDPIKVEDAGVNVHRRPYVRWTPAWPLVNIGMTTRPVRRADGLPARRFTVTAGFMGSLPAETSWVGEDRLVPGDYHLSISGDAAFQTSPWTPFVLITVRARHGEWTGPTSQKRYIRLGHPGPRVLDGVSFSVWGGGVGSCYASFTLPRIWLRADGSFSAHFPSARSRQTGGNVWISGRLRRRFARGTLRVADMFEGCRTPIVRWSARRR
jgi:hypothetical protein